MKLEFDRLKGFLVSSTSFPFTEISEALKPRLARAAGAYPGFRSMKRLGVFLLPLDGILVNRRSLQHNLLGFPQQFAGTHLYSWVERGIVIVKFLAQEHNTMSPARARAQIPRFRNECTDHLATAPPLATNDEIESKTYKSKG